MKSLHDYRGEARAARKRWKRVFRRFWMHTGAECDRAYKEYDRAMRAHREAALSMRYRRAIGNHRVQVRITGEVTGLEIPILSVDELFQCHP